MALATLDYNFEPEAEASRWNISNHVNLEDLKMDSNFAMLLCSLLFAISWVIYITYYHSRVVGYLMTKIINKFFISNGYFKIGSFTLNALSGKIMFRDVVYITPDYSVRVQDGYLIFRWWRAYVPKDVSEGTIMLSCLLFFLYRMFLRFIAFRYETVRNAKRF